MNQEKQREAYEKMLKKCPDILTPMFSGFFRLLYQKHSKNQGLKVFSDFAEF